MEFYNSKQDIKVLDSLNTLNKLLTACAKSDDLKSLSKADIPGEENFDLHLLWKTK